MAATGNAKLSVTMSIVDKATAPLKKINASIKGAFQPIQGIKNRLKLTSANLGLPKIRQGFINVKGAAGGVLKEVRGIGKELAILGGLGAGFFGGMVYTAANAADEAYKTAQKVGITTEAWTKLSHAARMSGVSTSTLQTGMNRLGRTISDAAGGNKSAAQQFRNLGISIYDQTGKIKSTDAVMMEIAEKCSSMADGSKKTADAMEVFGKAAGPEMIPLLNAGKKGIEDYGKEAERLKRVITDEQGKAAESFNDSMTRMKESVHGIAITIGNQLIPVIEPLFNDIENFFVKNGDGIATTVRNWVDRIKGLVEQFGGWGKVIPVVTGGLAAFKLSPLIFATLKLGRAVLGLGVSFAGTGLRAAIWLKNIGKHFGVFRFLGNTVRGFGGAIKAVLVPLGKGLLGFGKGALLVGKILGGMLVKGIFAACAALKVFFVAMLTNPIGWIIAAVAALAGAAYLIYKNWDPISKWFGETWEWLKGVVGQAWDWIGDKISGACSFASTIITSVWNGVAGFFSGIFTTIQESFKNGFLGKLIDIVKLFNPLYWIIKAFEAVASYFSTLDLGFGNVVNGLWESLKAFAPVQFFSDVLGEAKDFLSSFQLFDAGMKIIDSLWSGLKAMWESVKEWISSIPEAISGLIPESLLDVLGTIKGIAGGVGGAVSNVAGGLADAVSGVAGSIGGAASSAFGSIGGFLGFGEKASPQYGPPVGVQDAMRREVTQRNEEIRDAKVIVDFVNVPDGLIVKPGQGVQTRVKKSSLSPAYTGRRMGF